MCANDRPVWGGIRWEVSPSTAEALRGRGSPAGLSPVRQTRYPNASAAVKQLSAVRLWVWGGCLQRSQCSVQSPGTKHKQGWFIT